MLEEKTAKVFVVESATIRGQIIESLKKHGFAGTVGFATAKEALKAMEVETPGWIICNILPEEEVNAFHLLRLCINFYQFKNTRISFLIDESEEHFLLPAFELGLFSYLMKPFNKDSFENWIKKLTTSAKAYREKDSLVSADFLREILRQKERYAPWLELEKRLTTLNPGIAKPLLHMALPQYKLGEREKAYQILDQIKILDRSMHKEADELKELFIKEDKENGIEDGLGQASSGAAVGVIKQLGIKSCLVVDSDQSQLDIMQKLLTGIGVEDIRLYLNGEPLLQEVDELKPDLILMDWQLAVIPGPILIQRMREKNISAPIVITSSVLNDNDAAFIKEFGVSAVVNKPVEEHELLEKLVWAVQENKYPQEYSATDYKFRMAVEQNDVKTAREMGKKMLSYEGVSEENIKRVMATLAYLDNDFEKAKDLAIQALRCRNDNIFTLSILGKIFLKLKNTQSALFCFEKAQFLSPLNITRLCQLAELNIDLGNGEEAKDIVVSASDLDNENHTVQEITTKVALATGDADLAKETMGKLQSFTNVVSFLNNKAVAYAQNNEIPESIKLYHNALNALPYEQINVKATVSFNLAMAHVRAHEYEEAKIILQKALALGDVKLKGKISNLLSKTESAISGGKKLRFADQKENIGGDQHNIEAEVTIESENTASAIEIQPGDVCCYLLYEDVDNKSPDFVKKYLTKMPHFVFRQTILKTSRFAS